MKFQNRAMCLLICFLSTTSVLAQPSLSKIFTPDNIGPGAHSQITFTITNDSGTPVTNLSFTDVLPAAVDIGDPGILSTDCDLGLSGSLIANDGGSTITLTDAEIGANQSCSIHVFVTSSVIGMHTNPAVTLNSSAGSSMSLAVDLTVASDRPGFSKSFSPSTVPFGQRSTLTFTIDNSLNADTMNSLRFTDNFPTGILVADPPNLTTDCTDAEITAVPDTNFLEMLGTNLLNAGTTCTISLDVVGSNIGTVDNQTSDFTSNSGFTQLSSGMALASLELTGTPLTLTKEFTNDPVVPGSHVELSFTISNFDRNFSASNLAFFDDLTTLAPPLAGLTFDSLLFNDCGGSVSGANTTLIDFSGGNLAAASSCQIKVQLSIPVGATTGIYTNTTSTVTGTVDGNFIAGNQASDDLFINFAPVFTKEFIDDPAAAGGSTTLRFTITNTDPNGAITDLTFSDDIGGVIFPRTGTVPNMAANGLVAAGGLDPEPLIDPCGAGSVLTIPDPNDTNPSPPFPNFPPDPTLLNFSGGNLAAAGNPGDSCTFDVVLDIPLETPSGTYTNTTTNLASTNEVYTAATDDLLVIAAPSLVKSFSDDPVAPGGSVTLEFRLSNSENAPTDATAISFTDDMSFLPGIIINLPPTPDPPCGAGSTLTAPGNVLTLTGGSLLPSEECTFSVTLDIPVATTPGTYTNVTSNVSATISGISTASDPATADLRVSGLLFSKSFVDDPVVAGDIVTLRFDIENIHPIENATNITFSDSLANVLPGTPDLSAILPPTMDTCGGVMSGTTLITYSGGSVATGTSCSIEINVQVPLGAPDGQYNNITSSLTATQGSNVSIDPAADILTINSTVIGLNKIFTDDPVNPGNQVTLEFTVTNLDSNNALTDISFTDDLDAVLTGLTATGLPANDICGAGSQLSGINLLSFTGGNLAAGGSCTFSVTLQVPAATTPGMYLNTTSTATGLLNGLAVTGNSASDILNVTNAVSFGMSFDGPTTATGTAVITFNINNAATINTSNMAFTHDLVAVIPGLVATGLPINDVCGSGSQLSGTSVIAFTAGNLLAGTNCTFNVTVQVPVTATAGTYPNTTSNLTDNGLFLAAAANAALTIEPPPAFNKQFSPNLIGVGQSSTLQFNIDNTTSALAANNLDFTDNFPAGLQVASPANASTTCSGGTLTATVGSSTLTYSGGSLPAGVSCMVAVDVTAVAPGVLLNTTGDLTSSSGNSGTANDTLTVNPQPGFSKVFSPNPTVINGVVTLTFAIDNAASTVAATGLDFTDNMPSGLILATPSNASTTCTGGTLTAVSGSSTVSYTGGTVAAGASCSVTVDVTTDTAGDYLNTTGDLTSSLGNSGSATDTLTVSDALLFAKSFTPDVILSGDVSTLTFTLDNSANNQPATSIDFIDNMPVEILVANPANINNTCTGGTLTATSGSSTISYTGGSVAANSTCEISVDVTSSIIGSFTNVSGTLTSSLGNSGTATDMLDVINPLLFDKSFMPDVIVSGAFTTLSFTIDNTVNNQPVTAIDFVDNMPAEILIATPSNISNTCTGGTLTAVSGTSSINYSGGSVAANSSCSISVDVTSSTLGSHTNLTGDLTSSSGNSGTATDTLTVELGLTMNKTFTNNSVSAGGNVEMILELTNQSSLNATQISFSDDLSAFVPGATALNLPLNDVCGSGSLVSGSQLISLTGGSLNGGDSCQISIQVSIPNNTATGAYINTTGPITADIGGNAVDGGTGSTDNAILNINGVLIMVPTSSFTGLLLLTILLLMIGQRWFIRR